MTGFAIALALKIDDAEIDIARVGGAPFAFGTRNAFEPRITVDADELRRKRQLVAICFAKRGDQQQAPNGRPHVAPPKSSTCSPSRATCAAEHAPAPVTGCFDPVTPPAAPMKSNVVIVMTASCCG